MHDKSNDDDDENNQEKDKSNDDYVVDDDNDQMDIESKISLDFLEKSLQNLSIDIEHEDDSYITSLLAKKAKCSTPLTKVPHSHTESKLNEQDIILDKMIMIMPNVLKEWKGMAI